MRRHAHLPTLLTRMPYDASRRLAQIDSRRTRTELLQGDKVFMQVGNIR